MRAWGDASLQLDAGGPPLTLDLELRVDDVLEAVQHEAAQQHKEREREAHRDHKAVAQAGAALLNGFAA